MAKTSIFVSAGEYLLEHGIRDAIVDQNFLLPLAIAVACADGVQVSSSLRRRSSFLEVVGGLIETWFDHRGILLDGEVRVVIFVAANPALALGDDMRTKFLGGEFVSPIAGMRLR